MTPASPASPQRARVPVWLDRLAAVGWRVLATAALGIVLVAAAILLATTTASVLVALVVSAPLAPTVAGLRRRGASRTIASAVACLAGLAILAVTVVLLLVAVLPTLGDLLAAARNGVEDLAGRLAAAGAPDWLLDSFGRLSDATREALTVNLAALGQAAVTVGTVAVLAGFLTFFLLQDGDLGWRWLMAQLEPWQAAALTPSALVGLDRVSRYVRRTGALAVLDALVAAGLLGLVGAPLAGPMIALVFVAGFVPYLGAIVASAVVGLAVLALVGPGPALFVLAGLAIGSIVEERLLAGTAIGRGAGVHPLLVLVAIPAGAALFGVLGVVTVLPLSVFGLAVYRSVIVVLDIPAEDATPTPDGAWRVPAWLDRLAQWSWRGLVATGLVVLAVRAILVAPVVVVPAVLAIVIAATLLPLMTALSSRGWSRGWAAAVTTVGATVAVTLVVALTVAWMTEPLQQILDTALRGAGAADGDWLGDAAGVVASTLTVSVGDLLRSLLVAGLAVALMLLMTFFFLRDGSVLWDAATSRLHGARRDHLDEAGERAVGVLSGYMVGTALISLFGAVTNAIIMALLGLPLVLPIAVLTFFGGFIPYIGSFVTTALAFLVAVAVGSPRDIAIMAVYTVVFNLVQGSGIAPIVYGRALSLHPAIVLLAVPVGSTVAGILGMFLVVPIAAIVSATWRLVLATIEDDAPGGGGVSAAAPT